MSVEGEATEEAIEELHFLARSPYRVGLLAELDGRESSRDELRERCDASRTALQRNLDALEERGWLRNSDRTYELGLLGEEIAEPLFDLVDAVEAAERLRPFVRWAPEEFDLDPRTLADATVVTATGGDPYAIQNRYVDRLRSASRVRALLPTTGLRSWEIGHERVLAGELECELVVGPDVAETITSSPDYRPLLEDLLDTGRHDVFVADEPIPYCVSLMDERVQIGVNDEGDVPRALVESDREEIREWAEAEYERYRDEAEALSVR